MQNILAQNQMNGMGQKSANGIGGMRTLWEQRIHQETMEKHVKNDLLYSFINGPAATNFMDSPNEAKIQIFTLFPKIQ